MKKSYLLFVSVLVLICAFAFAQSGSGFEKLRPAGPASSAILRPRPPIIPIPPPQIVIVGAKNLKPIAISDLDVDIQIVGNLAMTTYDMTFKNPNASLLEGEFIMPLGENQTVAALALDINGKMRDGVAVEKEKARKTFEAIVRAGADPALVEKTSGNQFKTRIYPLNANGTRRVKVTIEEPLSAKGDNYVYYLPLQFGQKLNFKIQAEVENKQTALPQTEGDLSAFRFSKAGEVYKAVFESKDYTLNNKISFLMPKNKSTPVFTHKNAGKTYFYGDVSVKKSEKAKTLPKKIAIIWDTTLSGEKRDKEKELELLNAYFKKLKTADVSFSTFKLKQDKSKKFMIRDSNWDDLKKEIESIVYDGATRLDGIDLKNTKTDEILLFTDALSTLGSTELNAGSAPIIVINSSSEFDRGAAVNAVRKTGGSFINLASTPLDEAVNTLTKQSVRLIRYEYKASDFENITPAQSGDLKENFTFAGILKTNQSEITLVFGYDDKNITETKKITVSAGGDNPAVMRLWAQQRIRELELNKEKNEEAIKALGKEFSVVTDYTSLLVLEELSDYIRYEITPPAELAGAYNQALQNKRKDAQAKEQSILESAIAEVKEIKDWWEKDFKAEPPSKPYESFRG
ncbi:MAG: hypothetical protein LBG46_04930, partial [Elusimicrobiota bacterium]|nr:hypothetical protein [Elusimicrobiota bacterium]